MEDDLKVSIVEKLSNHWSDLPQIVNLNLGDQTKIEYCLKERGHQIEDNLKILYPEYLSNRWSDLLKSILDQTKI